MTIGSFIKAASAKISKAIATPYNRIYLKLNGVKLGKNSRFYGRTFITNRSGSVEIGDNLRVQSNTAASPIGRGARTYFMTVGDGKIKIGNNVGITNSGIAARTSVTIGDNVLIGTGVGIYDTDFHPLESRYRYGSETDYEKTRTRPIVIGDGAYICADALILKGAVIGKNSIIGARSIVSGVVPDGEIWAGNPARFIKKAPTE